MKTTTIAGLLALLTATPAMASDDRLEWWSELTLSHDLDKQTFVEFQTQQRARPTPRGNNHTYRLWLGRRVAKGTSVALGLHRSKEGRDLETRIIEQVSYPLGAKLGLKGRTRLEQRMIDGRDRTGLRFRQRVGMAIPLTDNAKDWALAANAEGFLTLRATSRTGDTGLTGLRTFVGFQKTFGKVDLGVGYTRQQSIRKNRPDLVGHAPTLNLTIKL